MKKSVIRGEKVKLVIEMILTLLTIPLALGYTDAIFKFMSPAELETAETEITPVLMDPTRGPMVLRGLLFMVFLFMGLSYLLRAGRMQRSNKPRVFCLQKRIFGIIFLLSSIIPLFVGFTQPLGRQEINLNIGLCGDVRQILGMIYWITMLAGRVMALIRKHTWRAIVLNTILIIVILIYGIDSYATCTVYVCLLVQAMLSLGSIMAVTFSHVQIGVLKKIVRKTYAAEIILGLLLLIFSFAYVFAYIEEGIGSFENGLWYCFAIVTTIGFGDFTATSLIGRALSVILGVYGIVVVALITSIIVNFYGEMRRVNDPEDDPEEEKSAEPVPEKQLSTEE